MRAAGIDGLVTRGKQHMAIGFLLAAALCGAGLAVSGAIAAELPEAGEKDTFVFMGHGTHHFANATYAAMDCMFKDAGHPNMFIGTVEGYGDAAAADDRRGRPC